MAQSSNLLKFSVMHWKADGVDDAAFAKWYQEEQVPRMIKIIRRHDISYYKLYVTPAALREQFQEDLTTLKPDLPNWKMVTHDVTSTYYVDDPQKLRNMLSDPDWEGKVIEFEKGWIAPEKADIHIGWETVYLEDGKIVNTIPKDYE